MKIEQINSKLKHKIIQVELASKPTNNINEDDAQIEIQAGNQQNNVAFVQLSDEWIKFGLKGSSNTYLIEYSKLHKLMLDRFERSYGIPDDAFKGAAAKWATDTKSIIEIKSGYLKTNVDGISLKIRQHVEAIKSYLTGLAEMMNTSNSGIVPGQELSRIIQALNSPYGLDQDPFVERDYYVVVVNKTPYAVATDGIIRSNSLEFNKLIDPIIWFGTLLEGDGNIDELNVPLGITA